jgi:hypothetical protein
LTCFSDAATHQQREKEDGQSALTQTKSGLLRRRQKKEEEKEKGGGAK